MTTSRDPRAFLPLTPLAFQVLLALADGDRHGYAIIREVEERTDGVIKLRTGTLYTLLQRLLEEALIEDTPPAPDGGTPARPAASGENEARGVQGSPPTRSANERRGAPGSPPASEPGGGQGSPPIKNDPRRRYYRLTELGRDVVAAEARRLELALDEARRKQVLGRTTKA